jgi:hypothetical protein
VQCVPVCRSPRSVLSPDALPLSGTGSLPQVTSTAGQTENMEGMVEGVVEGRGEGGKERGMDSNREEGSLSE